MFPQARLDLISPLTSLLTSALAVPVYLFNHYMEYMSSVSFLQRNCQPAPRSDIKNFIAIAATEATIDTGPQDSSFYSRNKVAIIDCLVATTSPFLYDRPSSSDGSAMSDSVVNN